MTSLVTFIFFLQFLVSTVPRVLLAHGTLSLSLLRSTNPLPPQYPGRINLPPLVIRARSDQFQAKLSLPRSCADIPRFRPSLDRGLELYPPLSHQGSPCESRAAIVCDTDSA